MIKKDNVVTKDKLYLFMQMSCVIMNDSMFFGWVFYFLVCFRFKIEIFYPESSKVKITKKHIFPNENTRQLGI